MAKTDNLARPVRPNVGVEVAYKRRLDALVDAMTKSCVYWIGAAYNQTPPEMAMDTTPAAELGKMMVKLGRRWTRQFNEAADKIADMFATESSAAAEAGMRRSLRDAGFATPFKWTPTMKDAFDSVIVENVSLIKSIPSKHFAEIEGAVMRSVQAGRDLKGLQEELMSIGSKTQKRAALIASDQNAKANAAMTKARRLSLGLTRAKWRHSKGGVHPRHSHVQADGKEYDLAQGCLIEGEYIMPGEKINCRCYSQTIIPGFEA